MAVIRSGPERYGRARKSGEAPSSPRYRDETPAPQFREERPDLIRFETAEPIPYRTWDEALSAERDVGLRCACEYGWEVCDWDRFEEAFGQEGIAREELTGQQNRELGLALQVALARLSAAGTPWETLKSEHSGELVASLDEELFEAWREQRGIRVTEFRLVSVTLAPEDAAALDLLHAEAELMKPDARAETVLTVARDGFAAAGGWYCPRCGTPGRGTKCEACGWEKPDDPIELKL